MNDPVVIKWLRDKASRRLAAAAALVKPLHPNSTKVTPAPAVAVVPTVIAVTPVAPVVTPAPVATPESAPAVEAAPEVSPATTPDTTVEHS